MMSKMANVSLSDGHGYDNNKTDRHCAFCLETISRDKVKICDGCKRRAYCSNECQSADWEHPTVEPVFNGKIYGYGQGHKDWCGLAYGEEDVDWKVVPIEGKGLGIIALRDFTQTSRILVEGNQRIPKGPTAIIDAKKYHPAVNDLMPKKDNVGSSSSSSNCLSIWEVFGLGGEGDFRLGGIGEEPLPMSLGLRISRVNHNCRPNASVFSASDSSVLILASDKDIKTGDEICYTYIPLMVTRYIQSHPDMLILSNYKEELQRKWGIVCAPSSCVICDNGDESKKIFQSLNKVFEILREVNMNVPCHY